MAKKSWYEISKRYYYGIRPLYVGLLLNFPVLNKGWPYTIVEGIGVGILNILELNLAKRNIVWSFPFWHYYGLGPNILRELQNVEYI